MADFDNSFAMSNCFTTIAFTNPHQVACLAELAVGDGCGQFSGVALCDITVAAPAYGVWIVVGYGFYYLTRLLRAIISDCCEINIH